MDSNKENPMLQKILQTYCQGNHGTTKELCPDCLDLLDYCTTRTENCPHQPHKPPCSKCTTQCYSTQMQKKIRAAMCYARPPKKPQTH